MGILWLILCILSIAIDPSRILSIIMFVITLIAFIISLSNEAKKKNTE
jgi:hypothetical protein